MVRISGVDLPRNKRIQIGLTSIFGIGNTSADKILTTANLSPDIRCSDLTDEQVSSLRTIIDESYQTEGDLRRVYSLNIKRLTEIGSAAVVLPKELAQNGYGGIVLAHWPRMVIPLYWHYHVRISRGGSTWRSWVAKLLPQRK